MEISENQLWEIVSQVVLSELERLGRTPPDSRDSLSNPRQRIIRMCRLIYTRQLTDSAGGNVSLRIGDTVYITPRYMGEHRQWEIAPDDIILAKIDSSEQSSRGVQPPSIAKRPFTVIEGSAERISREGSVHFGIYKNFPHIGAIIHAHPANCLVFACSGREMPSVTAMAEHFRIGTVPIVPDAPPGSDELASYVIETFKKRHKENKALVVLMPNHGVVVAGKDINEAYVILESVETNARVFLMRRLLETS